MSSAAAQYFKRSSTALLPSALIALVMRSFSKYFEDFTTVLMYAKTRRGTMLAVKNLERLHEQFPTGFNENDWPLLVIKVVEKANDINKERVQASSQPN